MIARIKLDYTAPAKLAELAADESMYLKLIKLLGKHPSVENRDKSYYWDEDQLIDINTDGPALMDLGLMFSVVSFKGTMPLQTVLPDGKNYTVYIQVPHIGLLMIDEVMVAEDHCTDNLQRLLDSGWRILCVCPPNAQRRPDYVLGRSKEK